MLLDNIVFIHQGRALTDSLKLAEAFDKDHKNVLQAIHRQLPLYSEKFTSANFSAHVRDVPGPNGAVRQESYYQLTRNAFMVVGMSFTGPKAAAFREAIVTRLEEMEEELARLGRPQDNSIEALLADAEKRIAIADKRAFSAMGKASYLTRINRSLERENTNTRHELYTVSMENLALHTHLNQQEVWLKPSEWQAHKPALARLPPTSLGKQLKAFALKNGFRVTPRVEEFRDTYNRLQAKPVPTYSESCVDAFILEAAK